MADAARYKAEDGARMHERDARERASHLLLQAESEMRADKTRKNALKGAVKDLNRAMRGKDVDAIEAATNTLEQALGAS